MKMTKKTLKNIKKDTVNGCVYIEKYHDLKLSMAYNIGYQIFIAHGYEP